MNRYVDIIKRKLHFIKIKNTKGITMVSLVVTIIILLILVGVSINILNSSNLLNTVIKGKKEHNYTQAEELLKIKLLDIGIQDIDKNLNRLDELYIDGYETNISNIGRIVNMKNKDEIYRFFVDKDFNVTRLDSNIIFNEENFIGKQVTYKNDNDWSILYVGDKFSTDGSHIFLISRIARDSIILSASGNYNNTVMENTQSGANLSS